MRRIVPIALVTLATIAIPSVGEAAATYGHYVTVSDGTGPMSFSIAEHDGFSSDVVRLGSQTSSVINDVGFDQSLGSLIGGSAVLTFSGDPFKVIYSVEGFGNQMVFSDTVTVTATALLNGTTILGTPEVFNVNLSDSCGGPGQDDVDRFCSTKQLLTSFSDSQSLVLPPDTSLSQVQFVYNVTQHDEHCVENYYTGSVITTTSACTDGGTSVVDTSDLDDPAWSGAISVTYHYSVPEPGSLALFGIGLGWLAVVRRRSRVQGA